MTTIIRCPFTGEALTGEALRSALPREPRPRELRDIQRGDRPSMPLEVHTREDGTRVEVWHGQRPTWTSEWRRETPRARRDRCMDVDPTGERAVANVLREGKGYATRPVRGSAIDPDQAARLLALRESLPRL